MTQDEILDIFRKTGAILDGHFKLSSGLHSAQYLQCARVLQYPQYAEGLCRTLAERFKADSPDSVVAPALGGILVSYEVARALNAKALFMERVNGKMSLRRGFILNSKERVLVVEDVVTTGLSTREVIDSIRAFGSELIGVGSLIDRSENKPDFGVRFESLVRIAIPTFKPKACPLCAVNTPLTTPGSRR